MVLGGLGLLGLFVIMILFDFVELEFVFVVSS